MASNAGCMAGDVPFNYLGLPIGSNMKSIASWKSLLIVFHMRRLNIGSLKGFQLLFFKNGLEVAFVPKRPFGFRSSKLIMVKKGGSIQMVVASRDIWATLCVELVLILERYLGRRTLFYNGTIALSLDQDADIGFESKYPSHSCFIYFLVKSSPEESMCLCGGFPWARLPIDESLSRGMDIPGPSLVLLAMAQHSGYDALDIRDQGETMADDGNESSDAYWSSDEEDLSYVDFHTESMTRWMHRAQIKVSWGFYKSSLHGDFILRSLFIGFLFFFL
ncbi:hypothetical protein Tco_0128769 [Tanacetum coccineum]